VNKEGGEEKSWRAWGTPSVSRSRKIKTTGRFLYYYIETTTKGGEYLKERKEDMTGDRSPGGRHPDAIKP